MIYIASDHGGFKLKQALKKYLPELGYQFEDLGPSDFDVEDDYPDFAKLVADKVRQQSESENEHLGILICSTGLGMCLAANKFSGIRAINVMDVFMAQQGREHLNSNVLCLGERILAEEKAKEIVRIWLQARFSGEARHIRRLQKLG